MLSVIIARATQPKLDCYALAFRSRMIAPTFGSRLGSLAAPTLIPPCMEINEVTVLRCNLRTQRDFFVIIIYYKV